MSIVQSPSTYRLSLITEHFFAPRVRPLVKKPSRSFPTIISISTGCQRKEPRVSPAVFYCSISREKAPRLAWSGSDSRSPRARTGNGSAAQGFVTQALPLTATGARRRPGPRPRRAPSAAGGHGRRGAERCRHRHQPQRDQPGSARPGPRPPRWGQLPPAAAQPHSAAAVPSAGSAAVAAGGRGAAPPSPGCGRGRGGARAGARPAEAEGGGGARPPQSAASRRARPPQSRPGAAPPRALPGPAPPRHRDRAPPRPGRVGRGQALTRGRRGAGAGAAGAKDGQGRRGGGGGGGKGGINGSAPSWR